MNLALHGFLLQVILSILNLKHGFRLCSAGEPGYLDFDNLPETNFSCQGKVIGGYYADVEAGCQMFHVCTIGQKDEIMDIKFLCLNGTVFDQETRVCERVDEVDCSKSERFYNLNLELYGNNAVTLSLHEEEDNEDFTEPRDDHQQQLHMTSVGSSATSTTTTTTSRPSQPSTTSESNVYQQHPTGYPQHFQPRPAFSSGQSGQSNSHFDDKNGGYHHQYIYHNDERNNNQATSYQLFSNHGVSSTTPTSPVHQQVRYSSTANPQVIHNDPSTVSPLQYHVPSTSSTIQTLLNSNSNSPSLINSLFHNHGIASTTEQFNVHNNNPREIAEYQDDSQEHEKRRERRPLEPVQSTNTGKVSKLTISPVPHADNPSSVIQAKSGQSSQQKRISINYLPTQNPVQTTISSFYPTQRPTSQKPTINKNNQQLTQHIHVPPPPSIPQLKPHQITINLPPPDIQRIVQNPSPLLPSQSRVIVTAKASVSDEAGRPLNASQLITLPLPTIPSTYDDYKEGDESFDPFYRDVPKIRNNRRIIFRNIESHIRNFRKKRSTEIEANGDSSEEIFFDAEIKDIEDLKANLPIIKAILFGLPIPGNEESGSDAEKKNVNDKNSNQEISVSNIKESLSYKSIEAPQNPLFFHYSENMSSNGKVNDQVNPDTPGNIEMPRTKIKSSDMRRTNNRQNNGHPTSYLSTTQRQRNFHPTVVDHETMNTESKDTVQLFLHETNGNSDSISKNETALEQIELLEKLNSTVHNKTDHINQEVLQTRSSSNSNKSNRRQNSSNESAEKTEGYLPRRNSRVNKLKSPRYYDEYDASESIEVGAKQRVNRIRQRPKERRIVNYRTDYIDEDDIEDEVYDEDINRNRKNRYRKGSQGRRVSNRYHNRNYDYEDDIEIDEKPRVRTKAINSSGRSKVRPYHESVIDARRRGLERRRKPERRRPSLSEDEVVPYNSTNESNLKMLKNVKIPEIAPQINNQKNKKNNQNLPRKTYDIFEKDDYLDQTEHYVDEYNESVEYVPSDYLDYVDFREHRNRDGISRQRNQNRFDDEVDPIPRRKSHRRNKSRKFNEETVLVTEKSKEIVDSASTESATLIDSEESTTIVPPIEYLTPDEIITSHEYDEYITEKSTVKSDKNIEDVETAVENSSTEGILKFTDELPRIQKKDNQKRRNNEKLNATINEEDYVDDNYEPIYYARPNFEETETVTPKVVEEINKQMHTANQYPESQIISDKNKTEDSIGVKADNKEDYYENYDDKLDSTTVGLSSSEYDDTDITTDTINIFSTSVPISTSTTPISTSSSTTKASVTTTTTTSTTTTTTTTPAPTTTTSTTSANPSTTPVPSSTSTTTRNKATSKFFKPISFRKNYAYNTPSTTPNTVVIRRGPSSTKATKPPPSYNDVSVKPLIRRLPLLSRTTTTTSEASVIVEKIPEESAKQSGDNGNRNSVESNNQAVIRYSPSTESVTNLSEASKITGNEVTTEYFNSITANIRHEVPISSLSTISPTIINQVLQSKEQRLTNEIRRQNFESNDSNNVPEKSDDSIRGTSKPESESTTISQSVSKFDTTTKATNYKVLDVQTTTAKTFKPSERRKLELTSVKTLIQKSNQGPKQVPGFNCLEKEMYRFYGDVRDCRLFHYCSPGFTARQVLDFRFVCEEGTIFDEESQSCKHNVPNPKCIKRVW